MWREAGQRLESPSEVVGRHEVREMGAELIVEVIVEAFDGGLFDRSLHPLDLVVGPRVVGFGEPVSNFVCFTDHVEAHLP